MRYAIALILGTTLAVPVHAQNAPTGQAAAEQARDAKVVEAIDVMKGGNPSGAIALLDPVLAEYDKAYPANGPRVFCADNMTNALTGLVGSAAGKKDAVALSTTWCYALWAKGYALVELQRLDEAISPLTRATQMMPHNPQFQTELGYVHQTLKHWNESNTAYTAAAAAAQKIEDMEQRNLALRRAWFGLGFNEIELGRLDSAEKYMQQALTVAPGDAKILNELEYIKQQKAKTKPGGS